MAYYYDETLKQDYLEVSAEFPSPQQSLDLRAGQTWPEMDEKFYDATVILTYAFDETYSVFCGFSTHEAQRIDN